MSKAKFYGYMENGVFQCRAFWDWMNAPGRESVTVTVSDTKPKRSSPQNAYYWAVVVELIFLALKEGGLEVNREGTHELLRVRFLSEDKPLGADGGFVTRVRSTTELDTLEFGTYLERCKQFAAEYLNVVIPEPNEQMSITA